MTTWGLPMSCLACGGAFGHVNGTTNGVLAVAVVKCSDCHRSYEITTRLRAFISEDAKRQRAHRAEAAA